MRSSRTRSTSAPSCSSARSCTEFARYRDTPAAQGGEDGRPLRPCCLRAQPLKLGLAGPVASGQASSPPIRPMSRHRPRGPVARQFERGCQDRGGNTRAAGGDQRRGGLTPASSNTAFRASLSFSRPFSISVAKGRLLAPAYGRSADRHAARALRHESDPRASHRRPAPRRFPVRARHPRDQPPRRHRSAL